MSVDRCGLGLAVGSGSAVPVSGSTEPRGHAVPRGSVLFHFLDLPVQRLAAAAVTLTAYAQSMPRSASCCSLSLSRRVFWLVSHTPRRTPWSWPSMVMSSVCWRGMTVRYSRRAFCRELECVPPSTISPPPANLPWQPRGAGPHDRRHPHRPVPGATYLVLSWERGRRRCGSRASGTRGDGRVRLESGCPLRGSTWPRKRDGPGPYVFLFFRYRPNDQAIKEKRGCESVPDPAGDLAVHVEVEDALTGPDTAGVDGDTGGGARAGSAGCSVAVVAARPRRRRCRV